MEETKSLPGGWAPPAQTVDIHLLIRSLIAGGACCGGEEVPRAQD